MAEPSHVDAVRVCAFCGAVEGDLRWSPRISAWLCEDGDPEDERLIEKGLPRMDGAIQPAARDDGGLESGI